MEKPKLNDLNAAFVKSHLQEYEGCLLFNTTPPVMERVRTMDVADGDIFVSSFPKSGTTWIQQIVYLIHTGVDLKKAASSNITERFPYMDEDEKNMELTLSMEHPRLVKSHLPYHLMPEQLKAGKGKVIYVARNLKDTLVSYFFFHKMFPEPWDYHGNLDDFVEMLVTDNVGYGPWWKHIADFWTHRKDDNVFFITYEELHEDLPGCIRRIASFLDTPLDDAQLEVISRHTSFSYMSKDDSVNYSWADEYLDNAKGTFMRKGQVGDWKHHLSEEMSRRLDEYVDKHLFSLGLNFVYD